MQFMKRNVVQETVRRRTDARDTWGCRVKTRQFMHFSSTTSLRDCSYGDASLSRVHDNKVTFVIRKKHLKDSCHISSNIVPEGLPLVRRRQKIQNVS